MIPCFELTCPGSILRFFIIANLRGCREVIYCDEITGAAQKLSGLGRNGVEWRGRRGRWCDWCGEGGGGLGASAVQEAFRLDWRTCSGINESVDYGFPSL